ncbi:MAG: hypothetical protein ACRD88_04325 [Terriglobia bacterium]
MQSIRVVMHGGRAHAYRDVGRNVSGFGNVGRIGRNLVQELDACRRLMADPCTPRLARVLVRLAVAYAASPVDLLTDEEMVEITDEPPERITQQDLRKYVRELG